MLTLDTTKSYHIRASPYTPSVHQYLTDTTVHGLCTNMKSDSAILFADSTTDEVITVRKRSLQRLCFYTCQSVILFTVGGVCIQGGLHRGVGRPPQIGYCRIRSTSGRYASYWNEFLLQYNYNMSITSL